MCCGRWPSPWISAVSARRRNGWAARSQPAAYKCAGSRGPAVAPYFAATPRGRGLGLTDAGDLVVSYGRQILGLNDQAVAAARGIAIGGSVRFGVPQDFCDSWLPGGLGRFSRAPSSGLI